MIPPFYIVIIVNMESFFKTYTPIRSAFFCKLT